MVDKEDRAWKIFVEYTSLIGAESKTAGLDFYGTDQISNIAASLTQSYLINELRKEINSLFVKDGELDRGC